MIDLSVRPSSFIENFGLLRDLLRSQGPEAVHRMRELAFRRFEAAGIPNHKDEEFKYLTLRVLEVTRFKPAYGAIVERAQLNALTLGKLDAITLTFVNGEFAPELSTEQVLPEGVFVGPLADGYELHGEVIFRHLGKVASLEGKLGSSNDDRFAQLNTAYLGEGAFVYVPDGVALETPVHIQWLSKADHGAFVSYPRTLIVLGEASRALILESHSGLSGTYFSNAVSEAALGKSSVLEHTVVQQQTGSAVHIATLAASQKANSTYTSNNINFGGSIVRNDVNVWIEGEHTETSLNGASVGLSEQVVDNHTRIDHAKPNCHSFETYKAILGDKATGVFNGKIFVYLDAQKTDAKQTNQAILLSPTATINTKPQLEIFADDVKCTHGATVGQLREDALFYLRARGIPLRQAKALLVYAFAAEVLDKISIPDAREALERVLFERLNEETALPSAE